MSSVLLKFEVDYADEFDVYGLSVLDKNEWEEKKEFIREQQDYPYEFGFGTNEGILFETPDDFMNAIKVIEITDEEAEVFNKYKLKNFGHFPI